MSNMGSINPGIGIDKFGIGIDKFDVELELTKWNWVELELTPCLFGVKQTVIAS